MSRVVGRWVERVQGDMKVTGRLTWVGLIAHVLEATV